MLICILYVLSVLFCLCLWAAFIAHDIYKRDFYVSESLKCLAVCFIPVGNVFIWIGASMSALYSYMLPHIKKFEDMVNKRS